MGGAGDRGRTAKRAEICRGRKKDSAGSALEFAKFNAASHVGPVFRERDDDKI